MTSKYVIGGIIIGGNTIRMNGLGMQVDGDQPFTTLPGATVREANEKGDLPPMTATAPTAAGAAVAAQQGGYVSEIEKMLKLYPMRDEQGRLVNGQTKEVITEPENTDPWPNDYGNGTIDEQVKVLMQFQFDHPFRRNQINIDGNDTGQPGDPTQPKVMFGTAGGKLRLRTDAPVPEPIPVTVVPTPSSGDTDVNVKIGAKRQAQFVTDRWSTGTARYHITAPIIASPTSPGHVMEFERPGSAQHQTELVVTDSAGAERFRAVGVDPIVSWSTKAGPGIDVVVAPGGIFTVALRHAEAIDLSVSNDMAIEVRNPA